MCIRDRYGPVHHAGAVVRDAHGGEAFFLRTADDLVQGAVGVLAHARVRM